MLTKLLLDTTLGEKLCTFLEQRYGLAIVQDGDGKLCLGIAQRLAESPACTSVLRIE
jgi:hypothetical protein